MCCRTTPPRAAACSESEDGFADGCSEAGSFYSATGALNSPSISPFVSNRFAMTTDADALDEQGYQHDGGDTAGQELPCLPSPAAAVDYVGGLEASSEEDEEEVEQYERQEAVPPAELGKLAHEAPEAEEQPASKRARELSLVGGGGGGAAGSCLAAAPWRTARCTALHNCAGVRRHRL